MRNFILGVVTVIVLPLVVAVALFLFLPKLEMWRDAYASIPKFVVSYAVVYAAREGSFERAAAALNRQADIAERLGMNDRMRRDLVENTLYIMDRARYQVQYAAMVPWLERLKTIAKHNYLARLMAAEAAGFSVPGEAELAMTPVLDAAPSFDRVYRPVIESMLGQGEDDAIGAWCQKYSVAQGAAVNLYDFPYATFEGQNIGGFFLELHDSTGKLILQPHEGFKLNERRTYIFEFGGNTAQKLLRLHIPSLPGLKVVTHNITLDGPEGGQRFSPDNLNIASRHGFFLNANTSIITSFRGDILTYAAKGTGAGTGKHFSSSTTITFDLEFTRLPLSNHQACLD